MRMMSPDTLAKMLKSGPNLIKHEILEEQDRRIVLTASTKELQEFMKKHANDKDLFAEPSNLTRLEPKEPNEPNNTGLNRAEPNQPDPNKAKAARPA